MRPKKFPQLAQDVRIDRRMSPTLARRQAFSVEFHPHPKVCLAFALIKAHAVEATTFAEIEQVLGDFVPQAEKYLDSTQFFCWISDEVLSTKEVKLFEGEVT